MAVPGGRRPAMATRVPSITIDLAKLELTEMAFKESLRMIPPVPLDAAPRGSRRSNMAVITFRRAGWWGSNIYWTHHFDEYWENPFAFDPLRFTPDQVKARHKYAWVPFGGGAHMCLGLHFCLYAGEDSLLAQLLATLPDRGGGWV